MPNISYKKMLALKFLDIYFYGKWNVFFLSTTLVVSILPYYTRYFATIIPSYKT